MLKKINICVITPIHWSYKMGGIEYQVKLLVKSLIKNNNIRLSYISRAISEQYHSQNYTLIQISNGSILQRYGYFTDTVSLLKRLKQLQPDVIYENGGCAYTGIAAFYAKKVGCKMIWHIASDNDLEDDKSWTRIKPHKIIEKKLLQWGIRNADVIIAQSESQKKVAALRNPKAAIHLVRNFHPLPNGIEKFEKSNQIVWVANFKELKQPELFINLAEALSCRQLDTQCLMIGAPTSYPKNYQRDLEARINKIQNLKYLGKLPIDHVNQIIAQSKLLINTSEWEGFPNTFIQAWMRQTPVVSLHCDPDHVIRDHCCGKVSGTMTQMVEDVVTLLGDDKQRKVLGQNASSYAYLYHSSANLRHLEKIICGQFEQSC